MCDVFMTALIVLQDLQLEYVHGYRGFDSRNNLHYINDGADIVFHAAGAGIVQNLSTGNRSAYHLPQNETTYLQNLQRQTFIVLDDRKCKK